MDEEIETATNAVVTLGAAVAGIVVAFVVGTLLSAVVSRWGRRSPLARDLSRRLRRPDRAILMVVAVWVAVRVTAADDAPWLPAVEHALLVLLIAAVAWWVGALAFVLEDSALQRYRMDTADNRHARRVRTQITVLRRLTVVAIVVCAVAAILLTFPEARAAGASLLASAGIISIVAGLAAQSSLANMFAGLQIAFTDAIRVDDVVVLEDEWGRIEEITMTYVVVHLWDDRRLILPSTYFTTTPFQNWTRRAADLLGTVELDLDFGVPVGEMRAELKRLLALTDLWDERVGILQVTDAVGGYVRVRALVSAHDAPTLFDLRCYVREGLVDWLQREAPDGLPRTRFTETADDGPTAEAVAVATGVATGVVSEVGAPRVEVGPGAGDGGPRGPGREAPGRTRRGAVPNDDRTELIGVVPAPPSEAPTQVLEAVPEASESALFSGSAEAVERSKAFAGPGQDVIDEREHTAEHDRVGRDDGDGPDHR